MAGHTGTIARRRESLARAALTELGERGRIDAGTYTLARGGTRERRLSHVNASVWYAWCERHDCYHYSPSWARHRADSHVAQETEPRRMYARTSVPLRDVTFNGRQIVFRDVDSGRRIRGAVVAGPARTSHVALRTTGTPAMRPLARRSLAATLTWEGGAGL